MNIPFFSKKAENVPKTFVERLNLQETELSLLRTQVLALELDIKGMRDKVLRKIQGKREPEEDTKPKDRYNGMLIPTEL